LRLWTGVFYTVHCFKLVPIIQVTSGGQKSFLKKKLQVCESQKSSWFVGDQILIFHHNLQINSLKILQCDFLDFFSHFSLIVEVYLWWKLQTSLIILSRRTCTISGWLNSFWPHFGFICAEVKERERRQLGDCWSKQKVAHTNNIINAKYHINLKKYEQEYILLVFLGRKG